LEAGVSVEGAEILHPPEIHAPRVARSITTFEESEGFLSVPQRAAERSHMDRRSPVFFPESV